MKIRSLQISLLLCLCFLQTSVKAQFDAGVIGGISIPNLSSSGSASSPLSAGYSSRLGPETGITAEYHLSRLFSVEARAIYSAQGGKKNGLQPFVTPPEVAEYFQFQDMATPKYLYANFNSEARLNYLRVPILAKVGFNLGAKSPLRFSVAAGPFVGFLLSAKQVTTGNSEVYTDAGGQQAVPVGPQSFNATTDLRNDLHKANAGVDANVSLAYAFGSQLRSRLFVEAGGNYGFVNIQKDAINGKNNTGAATVVLGYTYRFRHLRIFKTIF